MNGNVSATISGFVGGLFGALCACLLLWYLMIYPTVMARQSDRYTILEDALWTRALREANPQLDVPPAKGERMGLLEVR